MPATPQIAVMLPRDLPPDQVLGYARRAEELGFAGLWVVEDLGYRGGVAQAAAVLAVTSRLRVGIGVLPAAVRNPAFAAMELATLAQLFPGRLDVGVGHGMPGWLRSVGAWPASPLRALGEHLSTLRALLSGQVVTTPDALVPLDGVALDPAVLPTVLPPLLAGVRGPRSLALAGRVADGTVLAEPCTPQYVRAAVEQIDAPGPHAVVAYNVGSVHEDAQAALDEARPGLAWIGEPDWEPHLRPLPFAAELAELRTRCTSPQDFAARLPDAWVAQLALAGTPAQVRSRIDELGAAGVTTSVFIPAATDPSAGLEQLARVI